MFGKCFNQDLLRSSDWLFLHNAAPLLAAMLVLECNVTEVCLVSPGLTHTEQRTENVACLSISHGRVTGLSRVLGKWEYQRASKYYDATVIGTVVTTSILPKAVFN